MEIKVDEISELLRKQITDFEKKVDVSEVGSVISVGDGIARVYGLDKCMARNFSSSPAVLWAWPSTWKKTPSERSSSVKTHLSMKGTW